MERIPSASNYQNTNLSFSSDRFVSLSNNYLTIVNPHSYRNPAASDVYEINMRVVRDADDALHWISILLDKSWMTTGVLRQVASIFRLHLTKEEVTQ